ncbi:MAG: protein-L-isoaspartate(D-aspartate) O-methyltransferase [Gemmatimonadetes bacterium]|nr:protein-L-isoaspartate(D-aspartate) O-methyltransferase [Gemmatimonadota bacterium]
MVHPARILTKAGLPFVPAALLLLPVLAPAPGETQEPGEFERQRRTMVRDQIVATGIEDTATIRAMSVVPRHEFVPARYRGEAYADHPVPIGYGQTISQPYIVAFMTEVLRPRAGMKVLEVGTGSGYQAAVLAEIGLEVYTIEIFRALADAARDRLRRLRYGSAEVRHGDGFFGWPEEAPFDAIIVTAAAGFIPPPLLEQLKPGGRLVIPVGSVYGVQNLVLVDKGEDGKPRTRTLLPVRFVPLLRGLR